MEKNTQPKYCADCAHWRMQLNDRKSTLFIENPIVGIPESLASMPGICTVADESAGKFTGSTFGGSTCKAKDVNGKELFDEMADD